MTAIVGVYATSVVEAISWGMNNAEIADTVFMSVGTVRNHISSILAKLVLKNRTQIVVAYFRAYGDDRADGVRVL